MGSRDWIYGARGNEDMVTPPNYRKKEKEQERMIKQGHAKEAIDSKRAGKIGNSSVARNKVPLRLYLPLPP